MNGILRMPRRKTHRDEIAGGRRPCITIAMPLDPAFGFAMVGVFFQDRRCHEYYFYTGNEREAVISTEYFSWLSFGIVVGICNEKWHGNRYVILFGRRVFVWKKWRCQHHHMMLRASFIKNWDITKELVCHTFGRRVSVCKKWCFERQGVTLVASDPAPRLNDSIEFRWSFCG